MLSRGDIKDFIKFAVPFQPRTDAQLVTLINYAEVKICAWCKLIRTRDESNTSSASTQNYSLHANFLDFDPDEPVLFDGKALEKRDLHYMQEEYGDTVYTQTGEPIEWFQPSGYTEIYLYPTPNSTYASKTITIPQIIRPTAMASDSSYPYNGIAAFYDYHDVVLSLCIEILKADLAEIQQVLAYFRQTHKASLDELADKAYQLRRGRIKRRVGVNDNLGRRR